MKLDERVTIRLTTSELEWFREYAGQIDEGVATTMRDALGYFIIALTRERDLLDLSWKKPIFVKVVSHESFQTVYTRKVYRKNVVRKACKYT